VRDAAGSDLMGLWASYFLCASYLHYRGVLRLEPVPNFVLAVLLAVPLPSALAGSRAWRAARQALAVAAAVALLWRQSWLPGPGRTARLLGEMGGLGAISPAYLLRVIGGSLSLVDAGVLVVVVAACVFLARRIVLAPLAFAAILSVPLLAASRGAEGTAGEVARFFEAESHRSVRFPERPAGVEFDVILLHVCSLSWDDLRASGLDGHPLLREFDLVFTAFNSVSSYTNPSAIRLLRSACGQTRHADLYGNAMPECYLLDALRRAGYRTGFALDNDAPAYRFVEEARMFGHADAPLPFAGLPVRQIDFDRTPIYDDGALLARWLDDRKASPARRAALYADLTTLHGGARRVEDDRWWTRSRKDLYREAGEHLFETLEQLFRRLEASGRRTLVVFVPEHGTALAGSAFQPPDVREVPLPAITTVPVAVKLVGPGLAPTPARQVTIGKPTSYLAIAHLLASALDARSFRPEALFTDEAIARIPETPFVAENEATTVVRTGDAVLWRRRNGAFEPVPAADAASPAPAAAAAAR
jgi:cellulose biosynthesis protein BcsG